MCCRFAFYTRKDKNTEFFFEQVLEKCGGGSEYFIIGVFKTASVWEPLEKLLHLLQGKHDSQCHSRSNKVLKVLRKCLSLLNYRCMCEYECTKHTNPWTKSRRLAIWPSLYCQPVKLNWRGEIIIFITIDWLLRNTFPLICRICLIILKWWVP